MEINEVVSKLPDKEKSYYFGAAGFSVESKTSFEETQLGYRVDPEGDDLTGSDEGGWLKSWYVIGNDTLVGDPFFVDISLESLPVYTAMHGEGSWNPDLVSESLLGFLASIDYLKDKSKQEEDLIDPDDNTIVDKSELSEIHNKILSFCGDESSFFWECFFEQHQEWIDESEE